MLFEVSVKTTYVGEKRKLRIKKEKGKYKGISSESWMPL